MTFWYLDLNDYANVHGITYQYDLRSCIRLWAAGRWRSSAWYHTLRLSRQWHRPPIKINGQLIIYDSTYWLVPELSLACVLAFFYVLTSSSLCSALAHLDPKSTVSYLLLFSESDSSLTSLFSVGSILVSIFCIWGSWAVVFWLLLLVFSTFIVIELVIRVRLFVDIIGTNISTSLLILKTILFCLHLDVFLRRSSLCLLDIDLSVLLFTFISDNLFSLLTLLPGHLHSFLGGYWCRRFLFLIN